MRSRIQYIKLNNFKSFVGQVTVGPLKDFTVFVGTNVVGRFSRFYMAAFAIWRIVMTRISAQANTI